MVIIDKYVLFYFFSIYVVKIYTVFFLIMVIIQFIII